MIRQKYLAAIAMSAAISHALVAPVVMSQRDPVRVAPNEQRAFIDRGRGSSDRFKKCPTFGIKSKGRKGAWIRSRVMMAELGQAVQS